MTLLKVEQKVFSPTVFFFRSRLVHQIFVNSHPQTIQQQLRYGKPPPRFPKVSTKTTLSSAHSTLVAWVFLGLSYPLTYSLYHFIYGSPLTYHYNGISQAFWSQVINSTFFARLRCSMSQLSAQKGEQIRWDEPNVQPGEWLTWDFCFWKHLKTLGFLGIHMVDTPFFVIVMLLLGNSRCFYETYFLPAFF